MKRFFALLVALMLLMGTVPTAFAADAAAEDADLASHLVVHYDFEGESVAEALTDKATGGSAQDDLHAYTPDNKNTDPSGQAVEATAVDSSAFTESFDVDPVQGTVSNLQAGATLQAISSEDVRSLYSRDADDNVGAATWFIRFRLDDVSQAEARLVDMRVNNSGGRMFSILVNQEGALLTNAARTASKNNNYVYTTDTAGRVENGVYVNFALVMETGVGLNGTSGYETDIKYTPYVSYGTPTSASDWIPLQGTEYVSFRTDRLADAPLSLFDRYDGAGSNNATLTLDDVRLYNKGLTAAELQEMFAAGSFVDDGRPTEPDNDKMATGAYTVGEEFVSFYPTDDATYVRLDSGNAWALADAEGAMGGKAITCSAKASDAEGDGFTWVFVVPQDGDYTVWGRVCYPPQTANSLFYSVDGGESQIWDFPDEADAAADCYGSWQYFYLTERKSGTYDDPAQYGPWTIENGEWRHSPMVLHLTAGEHSIHFTGREAGMSIDELVLTSYEVSEYDPNRFEGNSCLLESCQFCGTAWQHYYSDGYAQNGVTAQSYFTNVLHPDAAVWQIPPVTPVPEDPDEPEDLDTPTDTDEPDTPGDSDEPDEPGDSDEPDEPDDPQAATSGGDAGTETPGAGDESTGDSSSADGDGCASVFGSGSMMAALVVAGLAASGIFRRKENS